MDSRNYEPDRAELASALKQGYDRALADWIANVPLEVRPQYPDFMPLWEAQIYSAAYNSAINDLESFCNELTGPACKRYITVGYNPNWASYDQQLGDGYNDTDDSLVATGKGN